MLKPSELQDEFKRAKSNPKLYAAAFAGMVLLGFGAFIVVQCLDGKCGRTCEDPTYNLGSGPVCGIQSYNTKSTELCGVQEHNSGSGPQCGVAQYKKCESGSGCGWIRLGGVLDIGKVKGKTCRHSNCGVETYNTCRHVDFGVATYKTCEHEGHGVSTYNSCRNELYGLESCNDPPIWQFWR